MNDTSSDVEKMLRDRYMQLSGSERVIIGAGMYETARKIVLSSFPKDLPEQEKRRLLYERFYGAAPPGLFDRSS